MRSEKCANMIFNTKSSETPRKHAKLRLFLLLFVIADACAATSASRRTGSALPGHKRNRFKRQFLHSLPDNQTTTTVQPETIPQDVVLGQRQWSGGEQYGRWSNWEQRSQCSRTCGGGVLSQIRTCLDIRYDGTPLCLGPRLKYLSCNIQDCPEGTLDFRTEQCSRFNGVPYNERYYDWIPYTKGANRCELNCMARGENFYYRLARRVLDGTKCGPDTLDVCVDGNCLPVGCDLLLGSETQEDKCRECGGDGTTCQTVEGVFDLLALQNGYNDIIVIPAGATNILIQERQATNNYLAIRNLTGHFYLNGNWKIDFPRELRFSGTVFHYERQPHHFAAPDTLRALGPTTEPLLIVLLYQEINSGVTYEYSVPTSVNVRPVGIVSSSSTATEESSTSGWSSARPARLSTSQDWHSTGQGTSWTSEAWTSTSPFGSSDNPQEFSSTSLELSSQIPDTYSWMYGNYGNCSEACAGGVETRNVSCAKASNFEIVDENLCNPLLQPPENRSCNTQPCPATWHVDDWEPCSVTCGNGVQFRTVLCQQLTACDASVVVDASQCEASNGTRPKNAKPCDDDVVACPEWDTAPWSSCDKLCGPGQITRLVTCQRNVTGRLEVFHQSSCDATKRPTGSDTCDSGPCEGLDWIVSEWTGCDACGLQAESRHAKCSSQVGKIHSEEACDASRIPEVVRNCSDSPPCEMQWYASQWTECSANCGPGVQTRQVFCGAADNDTVSPVLEDMCDLESRYTDIQNCTGDANCTATWFTGPWNRCTSPCGAGHRTRKVLCLVEDKVVNNSDCHSGRKPLYREPCNTHPCDDDEILTVGGCKDSKHGCCPDGITSAGKNYVGCPSVVLTEPCEQTEFGCCGDSVTPAMGPFRRGCPKVNKCADTPFKCCPDGVTPAKGPHHDECPTPDSCAATRYGCCPDGVTEADGDNLAGCDFEPSSECLVAKHGCCPDGLQAAKGPGHEGCSIDGSFVVIDETGSGVLCNDTAFGCCSDDLTPADGPDAQGCPDFNITIIEGASNCSESEFGCCADNITFALGFDGEGCDENVTVAECSNSTYGCCPDNVTLAQGTDYEGCEKLNVTIADCWNATYGCCSDNVTFALGFDGEGCDENGTIADCANSTYGCCPDNVTLAQGLDYEGCEENVTVTDCWNSTYGCCADNVTLAEGLDGKGCVENVTDCANSTYGCCPDNVTLAEGPDDQGCAENVTDCVNSTYGCCPDNVTSAQGPDSDGCEVNVTKCANSTYGCCPDNVTLAEGPGGEGCKENVTSCANSTYGCCPNNVSLAEGPDSDGCEGTNQTNCQNSTYGCCSDNVTLAEGPDDKGCPELPVDVVDCANTTHGCCPDNSTSASGANNEGCPVILPACHNSTHGCCLDGATEAQGTNHEGCPPCQDLPYGCCYDGVTPAHGIYFHGCSCETFPYGCCPDGQTFARGPNKEGCGCEAAPYRCCPDGITTAHGHNYQGCGCDTFPHGCCPDGRTPAVGSQFQGCGCETWYYGCCPDGRMAARGPNQEGCDCHSSHFGCCSDGSTAAQGSNMEGCPAPMKQMKAGDVCGLPKERGECRNFTVKWFFDMDYGGCSRFWYGGCDGNDNRFDSQEECAQVCVAPEGMDACLLPRVVGSCDSVIPYWFYDDALGECQAFNYSGCLGNNNRFASKQVCDETCQKPHVKDPCLQPVAEGPCRAYFQRWHFDVAAGICKEFVYGGCKGNDNNFENEKACMQQCGHRNERDVCVLPRLEGPCREYQIKWYYDKDVQQCGQFYYGGCEGNGNRFENEKECMSLCSSVTTAAVVPTDVCALPQDEGNCDSFEERWFHDPKLDACRSFIYRGCGGNGNNFATATECEQRCPSKSRSPDDPKKDEGPHPSEDFLLEYCHMDRDTGPCKALFDRWYYDRSDGVCKRFHYGGCEGNGNRFESRKECEDRCFDSQNICSLPKIVGPCSGSFRQFFFDHERNACEEFLYGGCEGNANHFDTPEKCETRCIPDTTVAPTESTTEEPVQQETSTISTEVDLCLLPSEAGLCLAAFPSWHYDHNQRRCQYFIYGGCGGNANRFQTEEECERICGQFKGHDVCNQAPERGPCTGLTQNWYFDVATRTCHVFLYGGCEGNANRFSVVEECERTCPTLPRVHPEPQNVTDVCRLTGDPGPCTTYQNKWFFDYDSGNCVPFTYGGCGGNGNRFASHDECLTACRARKRACSEPSECYSLQCPYGIEQYHDDGNCPHCRCSEPCLEQRCPAGTHCIVEQQLTEDGEPQIRAACKSDAPLPKDGPSEVTDVSPLSTHPPEPQPEIPQQLLPVLPYIADSPPEVVASSGSKVTLKCRAAGNPQPSISWYDPNKDLIAVRIHDDETQGREAKFRQLPDGSLEVENATPDDSGDYICLANNQFGEAERITRLVVQDMAPAPATIDSGDKEVVVSLVEDAFLHCNAVGWPRPSVTWWRDTRMLPRVSEKYLQYQNYTLLIRTMTTYDLGPYECRAYNGIGQVAVWEVTVFTKGAAVLDPSNATLKYFGPDQSDGGTDATRDEQQHGSSGDPLARQRPEDPSHGRPDVPENDHQARGSDDPWSRPHEQPQDRNDDAYNPQHEQQNGGGQDPWPQPRPEDQSHGGRDTSDHDPQVPGSNDPWSQTHGRDADVYSPQEQPQQHGTGDPWPRQSPEDQSREGQDHSPHDSQPRDRDTDAYNPQQQHGADDPWPKPHPENQSQGGRDTANHDPQLPGSDDPWSRPHEQPHDRNDDAYNPQHQQQNEGGQDLWPQPRHVEDRSNNGGHGTSAHDPQLVRENEDPYSRPQEQPDSEDDRQQEHDDNNIMDNQNQAAPDAGYPPEPRTDPRVSPNEITPVPKEKHAINEHSPSHIPDTNTHPMDIAEVTAVIQQNQTTFPPDATIQLDCVTSNSQRTLWYKNSVLLKSNERILVLANGTLLIKRALPIDSGRYSCEASSREILQLAIAFVDIKVEGVSIPEDCTDSPYFANCKLIVKAKYCVNKYYRRFCCRSCAEDGQISPANGNGGGDDDNKATNANNIDENLV